MVSSLNRSSSTQRLFAETGRVKRLPGGGDCFYIIDASPVDTSRVIRIKTSRGDVKEIAGRVGERYTFTPFDWIEVTVLNGYDSYLTIYTGYGKVIDRRFFLSGKDSITRDPSLVVTVNMSAGFIGGVNGADSPGGSPANPIPLPNQQSPTLPSFSYTDSFGFVASLTPGERIERAQHDSVLSGDPLYPYIVVLTSEVYSPGPFFSKCYTDRPFNGGANPDGALITTNFIGLPVNQIEVTIQINEGLGNWNFFIPNNCYMQNGGVEFPFQIGIIP